MPRPPGMGDPDKWTLDLPPGPYCSVGYSCNENVEEDGSSSQGRMDEDKFYTCNYQQRIQLYIVLDGHDGTKACEFAQKHIPSVILQSELEGGTEVVGRALRHAFVHTEREFFLGIDPQITRKITLQIEIQQKARNSAEALSLFPNQVEEIQRLDNQIKGGTTVVAALIYNDYLHIANVGDSRALLCYQGADNHLHVEQLSVDHTTRNEEELQRLQECGLDPEKLRRYKRLGVQQNTRSIGDHSIKGGYKDTDIISHATKEPGTAEPFVGMPIDLRTISSGFLVLMSDGLYEAYEAYTKRPSFVNQDLGYLIAQELRRSTDITSIAQNVVENIKQLYRSTCMKTGSRGRLDDITLIVRNLNSFPTLQHTVSYPGGMSSMGYLHQNTAPVLPNPHQNQFFQGYTTMTAGDHHRPPPTVGYTTMTAGDHHRPPPAVGYTTMTSGDYTRPQPAVGYTTMTAGDYPRPPPAVGYTTMTPGDYPRPQPTVGYMPPPTSYMPPSQGYTPPHRYHAHTDIHRVASDSRIPSSSAGGGPQHIDPRLLPPQSQPPWNQPTVSVAATTGAAMYPPPRGQPTFNVASDDETSNSYSPTQPSVTTPAQQPVRSRSDTHGYVNVSPANTTAAASNAAYSVNGDQTSPAHSTALQVPTKKDSGYVNVSPTSSAMGHKRYSDSQLDQLNIEDNAGVIPDRNARTPPPMTDQDPSLHRSVTGSFTKSPVPTPRRDIKPLNPKSDPKRAPLFKQPSNDRRGSTDDYDMYGWRKDDATPVSSQPSSMSRESENGPSNSGTLTGADFPSSNRIDEEALDADVQGTEDDDGNGMGTLTIDAEKFNSDFSEASDFEEEEDPDGMINSHVRFDNLKFDVNLSWDDI